jgi:nucleoside diphosphate kinase
MRPEVTSASRRLLPPPRQTSEPRRSIARRLVSGLLLVLVVAGVVVALLRATNGPATKHTANHSSRPVKHKVVPRFNPSVVTVAVLNGTGVTHLAKDVSDKLNKAGYKQGTVANAAVQTHRDTIIAYLPKDRPDAVHVAKALHLPQRSIQPADHAAIGMCSTSAAAGRNSCSAKVIVTVGSDLANVAAAAGSS